MLKIHKLLSVLILFTLLTLTFATPAYAFDGRGGDKVVVPAGEVIEDDLYVGANEFAMDGTVNGDVIAAAQIVTVNGTINGDLMTGAQTIVINGTVTGDVRAAGSVLFFGEKAKIGGDIVGAGYSLEFRKGSAVGRDAIMAAGQILMAADVTRNMMAATGALEIAGTIGGDVKVEVGEANQTQAGPPPTMFMPQSTIPVPLVKPGLTVDPAAEIKGDLQYTQNSDLAFPAGVVGGKVTRLERPENQNRPAPEDSAAQKVIKWGFKLIRSLITLILLGLFLLWLFPVFMKSLTAKLQAEPWPSLGWGVVTYAGFFFSILLIIFVVVLGAVLFGLLTLGGLSGTVIWVGILALFALILGFVLATSFLSKIVFGMALGRWILVRANPALAEHRFWPMVIGVAITVSVVALLSFPLIPGFLGGLLNFAIILFGLGAVWLWGRDALARKPVITAG